MYEYKIIIAKNEKDAEDKMNLYAKEGWRVVANSYFWKSIFQYDYRITLEREIK